METKMYIQKFVTITGLILLPAFMSCTNQEIAKVDVKEDVRDLNDIRNSGKLLAVTDFNSINYFIYKGQPLGFQYELLQELSDYLGLEIEVRVNNDLEQNFSDLMNGKVDLIASNITISKERRNIIEFTLPHSQTRQVLVQRANIPQAEFSNTPDLIRNPLDLSGKTIYVQKSSSHATRLKNLSDEIGETIKIIEVPIETEQLIKMVAKGEIDYAVADEDIAMVNNSFYPELDVETPVSFLQNQAWAVRKTSTGLKQEIDFWIDEFKKTRRYAALYNKYMKSNRLGYMVNSKYYYPETGRISPYDDIFMQEAALIDWDWKLIASMAYQESRFNPNAESWAGAFGLMQLMPATAGSFGVTKSSPVTAQIKAGVKFIQWIDNQLKDVITDKDERVKFVLASYNAGLGHVKDAMRLAEKYGKNPHIWEDNVEFFLLKKSNPHYFTDPVVLNGYARGTETYNYVREVIYRYNHYQNSQDPTDLAQLLQQDQ